MGQTNDAAVGWAPCLATRVSLEGTKRVHALPGTTDRHVSRGKIHRRGRAARNCPVHSDSAVTEQWGRVTMKLVTIVAVSVAIGHMGSNAAAQTTQVAGWKHALDRRNPEEDPKSVRSVTTGSFGRLYPP